MPTDPTPTAAMVGWKALQPWFDAEATKKALAEYGLPALGILKECVDAAEAAAREPNGWLDWELECGCHVHGNGTAQRPYALYQLCAVHDLHEVRRAAFAEAKEIVETHEAQQDALRAIERRMEETG